MELDRGGVRLRVVGGGRRDSIGEGRRKGWWKEEVRGTEEREGRDRGEGKEEGEEKGKGRV